MVSLKSRGKRQDGGVEFRRRRRIGTDIAPQCAGQRWAERRHRGAENRASCRQKSRRSRGGTLQNARSGRRRGWSSKSAPPKAGPLASEHQRRQSADRDVHERRRRRAAGRQKSHGDRRPRAESRRHACPQSPPCPCRPTRQAGGCVLTTARLWPPLPARPAACRRTCTQRARRRPCAGNACQPRCRRRRRPSRNDPAPPQPAPTRFDWAPASTDSGRLKSSAGGVGA